MAKRAVIVVGSHFAGKSKTINKYVKRRLGVARRTHRFHLQKCSGFVLSQSREETALRQGFVLSQSLEERRRRTVKRTVRKYSSYDLLVMAARPMQERPSLLQQLKAELRHAGYRVHVVNVVKGQPERFYSNRAGEILSHLIR